jgi:hypothetical protein
MAEKEKFTMYKHTCTNLGLHIYALSLMGKEGGCPGELAGLSFV